MSLSHLDESGRSSMVDVGEKETTRRVAVATGRVRFPADVYVAIQQSHGQTAKGTITEVARLTETVKGFEKLLTVVLGHRLTREQLTERLDVSRNTLAKWIAQDPTFPTPDRYGKWLLSEVIEWEQNRRR